LAAEHRQAAFEEHPRTLDVAFLQAEVPEVGGEEPDGVLVVGVGRVADELQRLVVQALRRRVVAVAVDQAGEGVERLGDP
jgi:hypothetical protein